MRAFFAIALLAVTAPALATEASYTCADGSMVEAVFSAPGPNGSVQLSLPGEQRLNLPQALSADGGRYAGNGTEFWIKGKTARLTRSGTTTACVSR